MDAIKAARELGKAIQSEECFKAYLAAKEKNDSDEALQNLIGEFNLQREKAGMELSKPEAEKSKEKIDDINVKMRETYEQIMSNENMQEYTRSKVEVDKMVSDINQIIALCCEGDDPDTCQPKSGCGSGCSSCKGCN